MEEKGRLIQKPLEVAQILQKYFDDHYDPSDYPEGITNAKILEDLIKYNEEVDRAISRIERIVHSL